MSYRLGINLGFAINRYPEPEVWSRIVKEELGLGYVQFVADLLNPFLPEDYVEEQLVRIRQSTEEYGIKTESIFTSAFTRVNHMMSPDEEARKIWINWFKRFLEEGRVLGAKSAGSHFGILTFDSMEPLEKREFLIEECVRGWQEISRYACDLGYEELIFEPMSIPREMACTVGETKELMNRVNADSAIPLLVNLDVGHAPHPDERDPYMWIKALAKDSPVIHLQQTELNRSNHWPFTEEYNKKGIIEAGKVMELVKESGREDALFAFEISHREHWDTDGKVIEDLKESVRYWRRYIRE